MVVRTRFHRFLQTVALYVLAAGAISYFGFHAYHGDHGIRAREQFLTEMSDLRRELRDLKRERAEVERRVTLMSGTAIDPDMLDQRAREILNYVDPHDLVLVDRNRR
ncbi:septum formation initiator family protein [Phreatobacter aquaticus]|uniref:Septum formation initiator family protein n=1 Tax=Phreatobacter aquaticus TaxID=2570229 RepID=A0A4D7QJZ2_9HYPH|nr:septum formation initiator family protein [Phreatobacter aquaticus]QCK87415.1 septum formation initiator family protein [Phreatobacter aquaticus]